MELRDYLRIIGKKIWVLITVVLIVVIAVGYFTYKEPIKYESSVFINVITKQQDVKDASVYEYDNYYALQSSKYFSDIVYSWLQDPSNVSAIYELANLDKPNVNTKNVSQLIQSKKKEPATIQVTSVSEDISRSQSLASSTAVFIKNKVDKLSKDEIVKNTYLDISSPNTSEIKPNFILNILIGLMSGLVISIVYIFMIEYMKDKK